MELAIDIRVHQLASNGNTAHGQISRLWSISQIGSDRFYKWDTHTHMAMRLLPIYLDCYCTTITSKQTMFGRGHVACIISILLRDNHPWSDTQINKALRFTNQWFQNTDKETNFFFWELRSGTWEVNLVNKYYNNFENINSHQHLWNLVTFCPWIRNHMFLQHF
jgi:hypothetical protein